MATISASFDDWLAEEIQALAARSGEDPAAGLRRVVEEWWVLQHFPALEFRDGAAGRRAAVRGGPDVWEILLVAHDYGDDRDGLQQHFGGLLSVEMLDQALAYAERFRDAVQALIADNERAELLFGDAATSLVAS
jgi:hypothetical protein